VDLGATNDSISSFPNSPSQHKFASANHDDLVKSPEIKFSVIPAKSGIQYFQRLINTLDSGACPGPDPGFTGVTTFYETINIQNL